jgi:hypothetical protein
MLINIFAEKQLLDTSDVTKLVKQSKGKLKNLETARAESASGGPGQEK